MTTHIRDRIGHVDEDRVNPREPVPLRIERAFANKRLRIPLDPRVKHPINIQVTLLHRRAVNQLPLNGIRLPSDGSRLGQRDAEQLPLHIVRKLQQQEVGLAGALDHHVKHTLPIGIGNNLNVDLICLFFFGSNTS